MDIEVLTRKPAVTCQPSATIAEVALLMRDSGAGSVVVLDEHGHLAGIVTDRDVLVRGIAAAKPTDTPVSAVMTPEPVFVYEQQDVVIAADRMVERGCRRLPVLNASGSVVGVVALDDLLQVFARQIDMLANVVGSAGAWSSVTHL